MTCAKSFLLLAFSLMASMAQSQLLWSIEHPLTGESSYLFGTIHMGDSVLCTWSSEFEEAFLDCDAVYGELDFVNPTSELGDIQNLLMTQMLRDIAATTSAQQDTISMIQGALAEEFDVQTAMGLSALKPFWGFVTVQQLRTIKASNYSENDTRDTVYSEESTEAVDIVLQYKALENDIEVGALEHPSDQMYLLAQLGQNMSWTSYYNFVMSDTAADLTPALNIHEDLRKLYLTQDIEKMKEMLEDPSVPKEFMEEFFTKRNINMSERMIGLMKDQRVYFFAVGAGHLPGEQGLISLLRSKGFLVTPIPFTFPNYKPN